MSRVATPAKAPTMSPAAAPVEVPRDKVAMRAYEKWCQRGCVHGHDQEDWFEAEMELQTEHQRGNAAARKR